MFAIDLPTLIKVLGILFIANTVQATFSFGGALIALPLLAFVIPIPQATPLMTLLSATIALVVMIRNRHNIEIDNAWWLIASACVGIPLGIVFLGRTDGRILKTVLSITVIVFTLLTLIPFKRQRLSDSRYAFGFGLFSGLFGGAYNISGPPVVLYGTLSEWSPAQFRATIQSYAFFTNVFAIAGYAIAGNIGGDVTTIYLYALPVVALSIYLGNLIHNWLPTEKYTLIVKLLLLVLAIRLFLSVV